MIDDPQALQTRVNELRAMKTKYLKDIKRFKTESGMKLEEIARYQEKKNALSKEAKEREKEQEKLEKALREKLEEAKQGNREAKKTANENFENLEEKEKLREKFTSLLEGKLNTQVGKYVKEYYAEAYAYEKNQETEEDPEKTYTRSGIVHTILVCLEEEVSASRREELEGTTEETPLMTNNRGSTNQFLTTFRVTPQTRNYDLIKAACDFWGRKIEDYECFDEKGESFDIRKPQESGKPGASEAPKLEKFWRNRRNENNQLMIIMRKKKKENGDTQTEQDKDKALDIAEDEEEGQGNQNGIYQSYNTLLPKLKPYININRNQVTEKEKHQKRINEPKSFGENHFCIVFFLTIIFICMLLSLVLQKKMLVEFYTLQNINQIANLGNLDQVNSVDTLLTQLLYSTSQFFPGDLTASPVFGGNTSTVRLYKPVTFRQYRISTTKCALDVPGLNCYHDHYDKKTRMTDAFNDGRQIHAFSAYRGEIQLKGTIDGSFGEYDLDAYITTFDPIEVTWQNFSSDVCLLMANSDSTRKICNTYYRTYFADDYPAFYTTAYTALNNGVNSSYIDPSTRALRISLYFFDISMGNFISVEPIFEFTPLGTVFTYIPRITVFRPNLKYNTSVPNNLLNIIIVIFATFMLLFVLYTLFTSGNGGINLGYFITLQGLLNTMIIILCYVVHTKNDSLNGYGITQQDLLTDTTLTSVNQLSQKYEDIFIMKSLVVGLLVMRLALLFKLNTRLEIIVSALQNAIPHILMMVVCFGPIALCLAFFCNFNLGPVNIQFSSFGKSFAAVLVLMIGNESDVLSSYQIVENIMIIIGFFFLFFLVLSVFPAISVETYRLTLLDFGEEYHKNYTWKPRDYARWAFSWVPNSIQNSRKKLNAKLNIENLKNLKIDTSKVTGVLKKAQNILPLKKNDKDKDKEKETKSKKKKNQNQI